MQINKTNFNFTSRNSTIRLADDIARKVNNAFPRVSKSKIENFKNYNSRGFLNFKLREKTSRMRRLKDSRFNNATHSIQKLLAFLMPVKDAKIGNCAESAQIASIAAKMNGIDNVFIARLRSATGDSFDHQVLLVQDETPYVIDSWLGFADYIPNVLEKYKGVYRQNFDFSKNNEKGMQFVLDEKDIYDNFLRKNISQDDLNTLKRLYPELLVK